MTNSVSNTPSSPTPPTPTPPETHSRNDARNQRTTTEAAGQEAQSRPAIRMEESSLFQEASQQALAQTSEQADRELAEQPPAKRARTDEAGPSSRPTPFEPTTSEQPRAQIFGSTAQARLTETQLDSQPQHTSAPQVAAQTPPAAHIEIPQPYIAPELPPGNQANERLMRHVDEHTVDFQQKNEQLQQMDQSNDDYTATRQAVRESALKANYYNLEFHARVLEDDGETGEQVQQLRADANAARTAVFAEADLELSATSEEETEERGYDSRDDTGTPTSMRSDATASTASDADNAAPPGNADAAAAPPSPAEQQQQSASTNNNSSESSYG